MISLRVAGRHAFGRLQLVDDQLLAEQGLLPEWLAKATAGGVPDPATEGGVHAVLAATWRTGSEGRRLVRRFLGRWLDQRLIVGPDAEEQADLISQLTRQGWQLRESDSVLVAADPVRGIPMPAPPVHTWRPHALIEHEARPRFQVGPPEQAVFTSLRAVEIRVRKLGGFPDDVIGVDLMNRAFGSGGPLTDSAAPRGEQDGTRSLFAGAMGMLRNPADHRQVDLGPAEAVEAVALASLLMRVLDRVEGQLLAVARAASHAEPWRDSNANDLGWLSLRLSAIPASGAEMANDLVGIPVDV